MSGIYIPGDKVPTKCVGCTFRDPEYGGDCVLMPFFDADTYEEQFRICPFKEIRNWFVHVPEHGRLIDAFDTVKKLCDSGYYNAAEIVSDMPTIIPADHIGDANEMVADKEGEG